MRQNPRRLYLTAPTLALFAVWTLLTFASLSAPTLAKDAILTGTHSAAEIGKACRDAGVEPEYGHDEEGYTTTYGCTVKNCDGKGGDCSVTCGSDTHTCVGSTPKIVASATLLQLLQNGSNVNHSYSAVDEPAAYGHPEHGATPKGGADGGGCVPGATCR